MGTFFSTSTYFGTSTNFYMMRSGPGMSFATSTCTSTIFSTGTCLMTSTGLSTIFSTICGGFSRSLASCSRRVARSRSSLCFASYSSRMRRSYSR